MKYILSLTISTLLAWSTFAQDEAVIRVDLNLNDLFSIEDVLSEETVITKANEEEEKKTQTLTSSYTLNVKGTKGDNIYLELAIRSLNFTAIEGEKEESHDIEGKKLVGGAGSISVLRHVQTGELTFDKQEKFFSALADEFPEELQNGFKSVFNLGYLTELVSSLFPYENGTELHLKEQLCEEEIRDKTKFHSYNYIGKCYVSDMTEKGVDVTELVDYTEQGTSLSKLNEILDVKGTKEGLLRLDAKKGVLISETYSKTDEGTVSFLPSDKLIPIKRSLSRTLLVSHKNNR